MTKNGAREMWKQQRQLGCLNDLFVTARGLWQLEHYGDDEGRARASPRSGVDPRANANRSTDAALLVAADVPQSGRSHIGSNTARKEETCPKAAEPLAEPRLLRRGIFCATAGAAQMG